MRKALGRGIGALFPGDSTSTTPPDVAVPVVTRPSQAGGSRPAENLVPIDHVYPNPTQPRKTIAQDALLELTASILQHGIVQPLVVRTAEDGYELIAGERRWRAAKHAGLTEVPVVVRESSDIESFELAIVENVQRQDLSPLEEAHAYCRLMEECGLTQEQVAARVGKNRATVANTIRLLGLPDEVKAQIDGGALSMGHARALLATRSAERQIALARQIVARGISVREVERLAGRNGASKAGPKPAKPDVHARALEDELCRLLGTRVRLNQRPKGGSIEIVYHSADELERLVEVLRSCELEPSNAL